MMRRRGATIATSGALVLAALMINPVSSSADPASAPATASTLSPHAGLRYKIVKLGALPGDEYAFPFGINAHGDVVGYSGGQAMLPEPFVYTNARGLKRLQLPSGSTSGMARDINDAGWVTGHIVHSPANDEAVRWRPNRRVQLIGSLGTPGEDSSYGYGINADRAVGGWSYIEEPVFEGQEAFRYTEANGIESVTPGARPAFGHDINDVGDVTGEYEFDAFRTDRDEIVDISGALAGVTTGEAINASGQVAITQTRPDANLAWRWSPGVGIESLGLASDDEPVTAHGINTAGDVVGRGRPVGSDGVMGGYLFRDGVGSVDLNDLLVRGDRRWYISEAWDINDSGQIVAFATNLRTFKQIGVRLDPKP